MHYSLISKVFPNFNTLERMTDSGPTIEPPITTLSPPLLIAQPEPSFHESCMSHSLDCPECRHYLLSKISWMERLGEVGILLVMIILLLILR